MGGAFTPLSMRLMGPGDVARVSALHTPTAPHLTPQALAHEYFANPDPGTLMGFADGPDGQVAATQAFVAQTLLLNGEPVPSLMSERTLLAPALRGKTNYPEFYAAVLEAATRGAKPACIWGSTAARKAFVTFGFEVIDCFVSETIVFAAAALGGVLDGRSSLKHKAFYLARYAGALSRGARLKRGQTGLTADAVLPDAGALADLQKRIGAAAPQTYFLRYTPEKLAWQVTANPHRVRRIIALRREGELCGLAIAEDRGGGIAALLELLTAPGLAEEGLAAVVRTLAAQGFGGVRYWGNKRNGQVAAILDLFRRHGSVASAPTASRLVLRSPPGGPIAPPVEALAYTAAWSAPV